MEKWDAMTDGALSELAMYQKLLRTGISGVSWHQRAPQDGYSHAAHGRGQLIGLISGHFKMDIGASQFVLGPGDLLYVPANAAHSARVLGNEPTIYLLGGAIKTQENF